MYSVNIFLHHYSQFQNVPKGETVLLELVTSSNK